MHDVIVVGAGVAGLTAASQLNTAGLDVVVLEARDRIGGRTHTQTLGDATVDMGAAWLHDPLHNPLSPYLDSLGIPVQSDGMWGSGMRAFSKEGWLASEQTSTLVAALYNFDPEATRLVQQATSDRYSDAISWYVDTQLAPNASPTMIAAFLSRVVGAGITGDDPSDISLQGMAAYEGEESGHNSVVVGGYRKLVDRLAQNLNVRLSTPVSQVDHSDARVTVSAGDHALEARWAVLTTPLGVLKSGGIRFDPAMPPRHSEALSRLKAKSLEKVVFTFDDRFWSEDLSQIAVVDDETGFVWVHDVSAHAGAPTLVGLYNPTVATTDVTPESAPRAFSSLLTGMFGPVPEPRHMATTDWASDPYSLGSYSFIPVGGSARDMATLAEPIGPRMLLAGEHTLPRFYGTVQAAWLSGRRAADAVVNGRLPGEVG